jgi:uncharacterized membrane protein YgdD (TMEM256/DUF423 family)
MKRRHLTVPQLFILLGSINAFLGIALGAFGAHGLKERISAEMLVVYQTGVQYHIIHSVGIILVGLMAKCFEHNRVTAWAGGQFLAGILIFSGSLYALSLTGIRQWGMVTPVGGLLFLSGWITLAVSAVRGR